MLKILGNILLGVLGLIIVLFMVVSFGIFMSGLSKRYVIYDGSTSHYTDNYKEKDNCIYFTDNIDEDYKLCGYYTVRERNFSK